MQNIAIEMNLSETAFVLRREGQNPLLRWYTPMYEIDLCGHATLAAAQIYFTEINKDDHAVVFDTKFSGELTVTKNQSSLTMNFPSRRGDDLKLASIPKVVLQSLSDGNYSAKITKKTLDRFFCYICQFPHCRKCVCVFLSKLQLIPVQGCR